MMRQIRLGKVMVVTALSLVAASMILPFLHELAKSFSYPTEVEAGRVGFLPREFTLGNYDYFVRTQLDGLARAFWNSTVITVLGVTWSTLNTTLFAFALSRPRHEFPLARLLMGVVFFSMVFSPPIIPYFLSIRAYGLMDRHAAIILAHTIFPFHLVILVSFFRQLPEDLMDACRIDGGSDWHQLRHVALPLSHAVLATISLFAAVVLWNIFMHAMLFLRSADKQPLQIFVRGVFQGGGDRAVPGVRKDPFAEMQSTKSAILILSTLPIAMVYPLLQKHFAKGVTVGAVKG